eukprot:GFUD01041384.1.p1 GENE.GFUD01041384.1~~GFUD01041384.1.p1  ORF type:complete len:511 (+),score=105.57 GFUD01041384.1:215-1534(+)
MGDRLLEIEASGIRMTSNLAMLDTMVGNNDEASAAGRQEQKRLLDLLFTKIGSVEYELRGFTENFDWIKKDLEFVKKGYKGIFELASSFSDRSSQAQCASNTGLNMRGVSSGFKSIQSSIYDVKGSISSLQSSMISLNKRIESLSQRLPSRSSVNDNDKRNFNDEEHQEDLKNILNNMNAIMNAVKRSNSKQRYPKACSEVKPKSIKDAKLSNPGPGVGPKIPAKSGLYKIQPDPLQPPFLALCDMDTDEGGWTVIQNRYEGQIEFHNKNMKEFSQGFGNLAREFWLGLDKISSLVTTSDQVQQLWIEITDFNDKTAFAKYEKFAIGDKFDQYRITLLDGFDGSAGDSFILSQGQPFSTEFPASAKRRGCNMNNEVGGWWFPATVCPSSSANLNGRYMTAHLSAELEGLATFWNSFHGPKYSLARTKMMIRPTNYKDNL